MTMFIRLPQACKALELVGLITCNIIATSKHISQKVKTSFLRFLSPAHNHRLTTIGHTW